MTTTNRRLLVGLLAFVLLYLIALAVSIPRIENNLTSQVEEQLVVAGIQGVGVTFSGRDGTMTGPAALRDPSLAAVTDRNGIRSLDYSATGPDVVVPTSTAEASTTLAVTTSAGETTTTAAATTTTAAPTTTTTAAPTTEPPAAAVDVTVTISDQSITLAGTVLSDGQAQTLRDAADAAFALQGSVTDELTVDPNGDADPASDDAVDGLAAFVNGAGLAVRRGTARLAGQALDVDGEAFSATAADTFNDALASSAEGFGLTVAGSVSPGPESPDDLQSSLDALLGRSGVNFAPESADLDDRSQAVLNSAAESIKQVPGAQVQIVGYTDNDGSPEGNLALSQARADEVRDYLVGRGVPADDLTTLGRGEEDPLVPNDTPENKARNRRIELVVQGV
jgi:outer membrane protein OmpA-like peptidoglycan-associated protein